MNPLETLPENVIKGDQDNPKTLLIYGGFKIGKSAIAAWISRNKNALWLDYESGSASHDGRKIDVIRKVTAMRAEGKKTTRVDYLIELWDALAKEEPARYDYIIHDKIDNLEDWAERWATAYYRKTTIGKNFEGDSVLELPKGAGYNYLREKFRLLWIKAISSAPHHIFIASLRDKFVGKSDNTTEIKDLNLTGKIRNITCGYADAIGYVYRIADGSNNISLKTADDNTLAGSRYKHLDGKRFKFSWLDENGEVQVDFDSIYRS